MNPNGLNIEGYASSTNTIGAGKQFKGFGVHVNQGFNIPGFGTSRQRVGLANRNSPGVGYLGSNGLNVPGSTNGSRIASGFLNPIARPVHVAKQKTSARSTQQSVISSNNTNDDVKNILRSFQDQLISEK